MVNTNNSNFGKAVSNDANEHKIIIICLDCCRVEPMTTAITPNSVENILVGMFSGQNVVESNQFLMQYVEMDIAWEISMNLFSSRYSFVQYFSANILYTKVSLVTFISPLLSIDHRLNRSSIAHRFKSTGVNSARNLEHLCSLS